MEATNFVWEVSLNRRIKIAKRAARVLPGVKVKGIPLAMFKKFYKTIILQSNRLN